MCAGRIKEGAGYETWWGFSPALDLLSTGTTRQAGDVNVLLIGSADPRHILKTIAHLRDTDTLHVWVVENNMEVVARQLLLLSLALTPESKMDIKEKTETFLDLFGNIEINSQTEKSLRNIATQLSLSTTDPVETPANPCLDTTQLKFKERDELDRIFKQWRHPPPSSVSMSKAWNCRVQQHLGTRYDSRHGSFDWDLSMKLHERGCGVINKHEYVRWRERGVAFEIREGLFEAINHSLISSCIFKHRGERKELRGYWGDIVSGPFLSFGIETDNEELLKTQNGHHVKTAQDISYHNVQELFKCLSSRCQSTLNTQTLVQNNEEKNAPCVSEVNQNSPTCELLCPKGVWVTFLPVDFLSKIPDKKKYSKLFNAIFCSASMAQQVGPSLKQISATRATLVMELCLYILDLNKEQEASFSIKVDAIACEAGFEPLKEERRRALALYVLKEQ